MGSLEGNRKDVLSTVAKVEELAAILENQQNDNMQIRADHQYHRELHASQQEL